jgi:hypothetical protein
MLHQAVGGKRWTDRFGVLGMLLPLEMKTRGAHGMATASSSSGRKEVAGQTRW